MAVTRATKICRLMTTRPTARGALLDQRYRSTCVWPSMYQSKQLLLIGGSLLDLLLYV